MKIKLLLSALFFSLSTFLYGQVCGTSTPAFPLNYQINNLQAKQANTSYCINIYFHIVRDNNGNGGINPNQLDLIIDKLSQFYNSHGIYFVKLGFDYIDDTNFLVIGGDNEAANLAQVNNNPNAINYYIVDSLWDIGNKYVTGTSISIPSNRLVIRRDRVLTSTSSHEVGHSLNLYHTFETDFCNEAINGSNCSTCGDLVCDTPADDGYGTIYGYNPDLTNIMSYYLNRDHFTTGQGARMLGAIANNPMLAQLVNSNCTTPQLNGDNMLCNNVTKTYNLVNGGNSVTWQVSSNLQIVSQSTAQITVQPINPSVNAEGFVKAILPYETLEKEIWIGAPVFSLNRDLPYGGVNGNNPSQFCKSLFYSFDNHITINTEGGLITQYEVEKISNNFDIQQTFTSLKIKPHSLGIMSLRARVQNECGWSNWQYYQYEIVDCGGSSGPGGFRIAKNPIESNTIIIEETKYKKTKSNKNRGEYLQLDLYNSKALLVKSKRIKRKGLFEKKYEIEINEIKNGRYFIKIMSGDFNETYQIIINKK